MTNIFGFLNRIHFIGIGGIGMSGIAMVLKAMGFEVSGSDVSESSSTKKLGALGIPVFIGHKGENAGGADIVVYSSAIKADNPERIAAREGFIPEITRGEMLGELMRLKYAVAVSGSHGKTTASSMVAEILTKAQLDPTVIIGGRLNRTGSNAQLGRRNVMVAEADESDRSFLKLYPSIAVITNIDKEHMENYADMEDVKACYAAFANKVPFYGCAVVCMDDKNAAEIIPLLTKRHITYGLSAQADVRGVNIKKSDFSVHFEVERKGVLLGAVKVHLPGDHIILNSLAAIAASLEMRVPFSVIGDALADFEGVERRMSVRFKGESTIVLDDYGHHPTEIAATLKAAREALTGYKLCVIFQPHRYTRTLSLKKEFATCFMDADYLFITDIYKASEMPIEGVDAKMLIEEIKKHGFKDVRYLPEWEELYPSLEEIGLNGLAVMIFGAGDISKLSFEAAEYMKRCAVKEGKGKASQQ